jgi:hypothetical protein
MPNNRSGTIRPLDGDGNFILIEGNGHISSVLCDEAKLLTNN